MPDSKAEELLERLRMRLGNTLRTLKKCHTFGTWAEANIRADAYHVAIDELKAVFAIEEDVDERARLKE